MNSWGVVGGKNHDACPQDVSGGGDGGNVDLADDKAQATAGAPRRFSQRQPPRPTPALKAAEHELSRPVRLGRPMAWPNFRRLLHRRLSIPFDLDAAWGVYQRLTQVTR